MSTNTIACIVCKGTGILEVPKHGASVDPARMKTIAVKALLKSGYSVRQVQKFLKFKSPRSVVLHSEKIL